MIKLLLVDDEDIVREGLEAILPLERLGLHLIGSYGDAYTAMDSLENEMPDILITDIRMPPFNGLELIERATRMYPALQCVVLSGYSEFEYAQRAITLGVRDYLLKPCTKETLTKALERICAEIRNRRERIKSETSAQRMQADELAYRMLMLLQQDIDCPIDIAQVRDLVHTKEEESALREAYVYLITHQELPSVLGQEMIRSVYHANDCAADIADGLTKIRNSASHRRGFVKTMCEYIHSHYRDEGLSLQYLADRVVNMDADYIGREFQKDTGKRFSVYLLGVRMEKAKALLSIGGDSVRIQDVANDVGLGNNTKYFSTLFRKYTGQNPKDFTKQMQICTDI